MIPKLVGGPKCGNIKCQEKMTDVTIFLNFIHCRRKGLWVRTDASTREYTAQDVDHQCQTIPLVSTRLRVSSEELQKGCSAVVSPGISNRLTLVVHEPAYWRRDTA